MISASWMIRTLIIVAFLTISATLYAQVNLEATGYDWIEYNPSQKAELVSTLYKVFRIEDYSVKNGVNALDGLYYMYYQEVKDSDKKEKAVDAVFSRPVMNVVAEILSLPPDTKPDREMLRQYGLKYTK